MKEIIEKARKFAITEIETYGVPSIIHFNLSNEKGQELAEKLNADKDIVILGTMLMDVKLGYAKSINDQQNHVKYCVEATKEFLNQFDIDNEIKKKIINCVEAHHGKTPYICREAEITANADCYRFIHPKGVTNFLDTLAKRFDDVEEQFNQAEKKLDEKWSILSLDICQKELEEHYKKFKRMFSKE